MSIPGTCARSLASTAESPDSIYPCSRFVSILEPSCTNSPTTNPPAGLNRGKAALEFDRPNQAEEAVRCMDGGILDGSVLKVQVRIAGSCSHRLLQLTLQISADPLPPPRQPSPVARRSPPPPRRGSFRSRSPSPRRGGGWRRSPPPHRRRSPSPYGRSPSPRRGGGFDRRPPPAYGPGARNNFGGRGGDGFGGGRGGGRDFRGRGGDVYRPRSRSRSPPYRRPPPRRSPDYVRGARSRSRSPRRSYSRSLSPRRSRSRSYSRSRSRSFSPRRSYSRSLSPRRDRSASMRSRSRSRTRSRSPRSASPRR